MMTLWTGFKQQNCASDNKIGPNEEEDQIMLGMQDYDFAQIQSSLPKSYYFLPIFRFNFAQI